MSQKIKVYYSKQALEFAEVSKMEKNCFSYSLPEKSADPPSFSITLCPDYLYVAYCYNQGYNHEKNLQQGQFQPDLWKMDVLELFIASDNSEKAYQEFNFSPAGAYWHCCFSEYRKRIEISEKAIDGIEIYLKQNTENLPDQKSELIAKIPRSSLLALNNLNLISRLNCCAIFGANPRNYYSNSELKTGKIDFHNIEEWPTAGIVQV